MQSNSKAKIITIEGSDGTGKATQTAMLYEKLCSLGFKVVTFSFPRYGYGIGGKVLHTIIKSDEASYYNLSKQDPVAASLFYMIDRYDSKQDIEKALMENDFVIMDRYYTANQLHQGSKFADEAQRAEFFDKINSIELDILQIPKADMIIYLTIPWEESIKRMEKRYSNSNEKLNQTEADFDYIKNSIQNGLSIATYLKWHIINDEKGDMSKEERFEKVWENVKAKFDL